MNATVMAMLLIAVHVMICVLMCVLPRFGVLRVEGRLLPFMLLVPLWGAVMRALAACAYADSCGRAYGSRSRTDARGR